MTRPILGVHWPNHPGHRRGADLWRFVGDAAPVTILQHNAAEYYRRLRESGPRRLIHVRLYHAAWWTLDPIRWAEWAARELREMWDDPLVLVSPANEQNIETANGPGWIDEQTGPVRRRFYDKIGAWNLDFWNALDRAVPGRRALALWSALADGHDAIPGAQDSEYTQPGIRDALERVDVLASHPYGKLHWQNGPETVPGGRLALWHMLRPWRVPGVGGDGDAGGLLSQFPGRPHFVSETGTFTHDQEPLSGPTARALFGLAEAAMRDGVTLGATPFIWDSGEEHAENRMAGNAGLIHRLLSEPVRSTAAPLPRVSDGPAEPDPAQGEPPADRLYRLHVVRPGDTLWALAGRRWPEIQRVVPIGDARELPVGSVLMIPEGNP